MKFPTLVGIALLIAGQSFDQTAKPAESFEVASVKAIPDKGGLPAGFTTLPQRSGGRFSWVANPALLFRYAYHLPDWRIIRSDKTDKTSDEPFYAIDATMDPSATEDQVRTMLQNLLADRFKLASHRETKEVQGYALVVAKNGPKIKAAAPGETHAMPEYFAKMPGDAFEGCIVTSMEGKGTAALTGRGVSMTQLADELSATLRALVMERTGLTGKYYFGFKFLSPRNGPGDDPEGSTIFTMLQDELGLRLDKQKGTVEVLVVDHFEKPTEN